MSSILKALRKLEEEKAASREGGLDIGRDILRASSARRATVSWSLPAAILGIVLLAGWGAYRLFAPAAPVAVTEPAAGAPSVSASVPPQAPVPSAPALPVARSAPPANPLPRVVAEPPVVEETIGSEEPASFPLPTRPGSLPAAKPLPAPASLPAAAIPEPAPPQAAAPPQPEPALLLTAIAYQDNPEARLAVINDLPVMIGTAIEEAVVEDILRDRVRLTQNGKSFEIVLKN